jgi:branched-chain amino acid transport system substrate-binding protein
MSRSRLWRLAAVAAVTALAAGVVASAGLARSSAKSDSFTLTIGDIEDYTGDLGPLGAPANKAVKLAVAQLNTAAKQAGLDYSFKLTTADTQSDPQSAISAARKVVNSGATCLTGPASTPESIAVLNAVTKIRKMALMPSATSTAMRDTNDNHTIFRTSPPDSLQARALITAVKQAVGNPKGKTVALGYLNLPYGTGIRDVFSTSWKKLGGKVVAVGYNQEQPSYDSEAGKLVAAHPAAFVFADYPDTFGKVAAALLRTGGYSAKKAFVADALAVDPIPSTIPAAALNGAHATIAGSPTTTKAAKAFNKLFRSTPGPKTGSLLPNMFDSGILCGLAAVAAGSTDPGKITAQLPKISGPSGKPFDYLHLSQAMKALAAGQHVHYLGVSGPINFDKRGDTQSGLYDIRQWAKGKLVLRQQVNVNANKKG